MVRRIYVEKKQGFDVEAKGILNDLKENLHLGGIENVRVLNRYDIEGIDDETYEVSKKAVFSEPVVDNIFEELIPDEVSAGYFAVEYLPGQYDQRADSAAQCIKLLNPMAEPTVRFARVICVEGKIQATQLVDIKNYIINPVDSREATSDKPDSLAMVVEQPKDVAEVNGFIDMTKEKLATYRSEMGFAMTFEDLVFIQNQFKENERRNPTITELKVIDTYWSDHCRHTTFHTQLNDIKFGEDQYAAMVQEVFQEYLDMRDEVYGERKSQKDICLMDLACIGAKYVKKLGKADDLDESDEINACSIKVKADIDGVQEDWLVMFKNETHNHPTEIEPFGGAATCLGGAIRDPLSGRVYVYQAMRVTGSGDPRKTVEETLQGKLPQRKIATGAAAGYSSYGNQIGLATGQVAEIYHEGYTAKRMEVGGVIGAAPARNVRREKPLPGDVIILVGGRTGRDGCGGATGSSKEHTEDSINTCGAEVQKGNPPVERNIQRLFRREEVSTLIKKCNDFGAGGVSVAIGELADSLEVNLDLVPKKYEGLDGTELAISESQERMAVVVDARDSEKFIDYAAEENLEAVAVAKVTDTGRFCMIHRGEKILDLSREFLDTNGVKQQARVVVSQPKGVASPYGKSETLIAGRNSESYRTLSKENRIGHVDVIEALKDLNCCSQKGLTERFDSTIGASSVLMPLGGRYQLSPSIGMAAKLPVTCGETETATIMTYGFDPYLAEASPFHGAMYAVIDSVTKQVAMGSEYSKVRLSFQEYFERMTEDGTTWGKPFAALLGALKVQKELEIPAIGGKDSMSGTFMDISVPPTLISFAVSAANASDIISTEFKSVGNQLVLVKTEKDEKNIIAFDVYKKNMESVSKAIKEGEVLSANTVGRGGIFVSAVKMAAGNLIGFNLNHITKAELLEPSYGDILLEVKKGVDVDLLLAGAKFKIVGETKEVKGKDFMAEITVDGQDSFGLNLSRIIEDVWMTPLSKIFPHEDAGTRNEACAIGIIVGDESKPTQELKRKCNVSINVNGKIGTPRVIIPTFPGTNCEMDSKRAFERAGAKGDIQIIRNLSQNQLIDSIGELEEKIRRSQIIMIPGGFSGGDEPDGSAKFITAVFRNERIKDAVTDLIENRDGLVLGICNGFQALIKLGLVPYGKIVDMQEDSPTLTYNNIGRHMSSLVRTKVASNKSPWLAMTNVGDIHTVPISHGEGRFVANVDTVARLMANGQIATQYVDLGGELDMSMPYNPNGSVFSIEGITSPDGRILGKMAHSERIGKNVYKNVIGDKDQKIFEAGVAYFK